MNPHHLLEDLSDLPYVSPEATAAFEAEFRVLKKPKLMSRFSSLRSRNRRSVSYCDDCNAQWHLVCPPGSERFSVFGK